VNETHVTGSLSAGFFLIYMYNLLDTVHQHGEMQLTMQSLVFPFHVSCCISNFNLYVVS
jgi:hypothetical protein